MSDFDKARRIHDNAVRKAAADKAAVLHQRIKTELRALHIGFHQSAAAAGVFPRGGKRGVQMGLIIDAHNPPGPHTVHRLDHPGPSNPVCQGRRIALGAHLNKIRRGNPHTPEGSAHECFIGGAARRAGAVARQTEGMRRPGRPIRKNPYPR